MISRSRRSALLDFYNSKLCDFKIAYFAITSSHRVSSSPNIYIIKLFSLRIIPRMNFFSINNDRKFINTSTLVPLTNLQFVCCVLGQTIMEVKVLWISIDRIWNLEPFGTFKGIMLINLSFIRTMIRSKSPSIFLTLCINERGPNIPTNQSWE